MQYIVLVMLDEEVVEAVGHWSRREMAVEWISENSRPGYDYSITKMYHPTTYIG